MKGQVLTVDEALKKAESFCAYQDRCHLEVIQKLKSFGMTQIAIDYILSQLIAQNFLNEERFARSFARGKHRIKGWGISRIEKELQLREISPTNIRYALSEIQEDDYWTAFHKLAENRWALTRESNPIKKKKKVFDYLIRKGYDLSAVYDEIARLSKDGNSL